VIHDEAGSAGKLYSLIIEAVFKRHYRRGIAEFAFNREELVEVALALYEKNLTNQPRLKNLGDVIYAYRHRRPLPDGILHTQPEGRAWMILGAGDGAYRFRLVKLTHIERSPGRTVIPIPDATPEIVAKYKLGDEQALLAKIRYNRLVDIFLGLTTYSLQNHLRTKIPNYGQIEIDELYVGVDKDGRHYVIPVQAKGPKDRLGAIQTIQDILYCGAIQPVANSVKARTDFSKLKCRAVSAQLFRDDAINKDGKRVKVETIVMFELKFDGDEVMIEDERHYQWVPADQTPPKP